MRFAAMLGWGIAIYAIVFLTWSGLVIHGFTGSPLSQVIVLGALIAVAIIGGRSLGFRSWKDILPYSFSWMVIVALLDAVYAVPYAGWGLYLDWNIWVGYLLVLVVPLLAVVLRRTHHVDHVPVS
jgi:hypothetical protein